MFAAAAPDPGSPSLAGITAMAFSFVWAVYALSRRESRDSVQWKAFLGTLIGIGFGFLVWGFGLMSGLY